MSRLRAVSESAVPNLCPACVRSCGSLLLQSALRRAAAPMQQSPVKEVRLRTRRAKTAYHHGPLRSVFACTGKWPSRRKSKRGQSRTCNPRSGASPPPCHVWPRNAHQIGCPQSQQVPPSVASFRRDYELEQEQALAKAREKEASGEIRQCNEGRWPFRLVDDDGEGNLQVQPRLSCCPPPPSFLFILVASVTGAVGWGCWVCGGRCRFTWSCPGSLTRP